MKKLSEILEECIEAGTSGRRSLEESLALYPAYAEELEPLLRTALSVSESFQSYNPPAAAEQRVRTRFLADAAARRNLRHLEDSFQERGWLAGLFRKPVFGGLAAAAAVVAITVAVAAGGVDLGTSGGKGGSSVSAPARSTVVSDLGEHVTNVSTRIDSGGRLETNDVVELSSLLAMLRASSDEELQASATELGTTLPAALSLLEGGGLESDDPVVMDAEEAIRDVAAAIGLDLPGPVDAGDATPGPTDPPAEPTGAPAEATPPAAEGTPAPTPTPQPSPQPSPTATADTRAPPGFLP